MSDVPLPDKNPFDKTHLYDYDVPAVGVDMDPDVAALEVKGEAREEARRENAAARALTEGRAFGILAEFVEGQKQATMNKLMLVPITEANKDELNYERGVVHGLMLALKYARAIADGAQATIELLREEDKLDARTQQ